VYKRQFLDIYLNKNMPPREFESRFWPWEGHVLGR
jgi:hypothetical protein